MAQELDRSGKYLIFHLDGEEFGVHVRQVKEIIGLQEITVVPRTPACLKGVINLRGKVVPVVDLRLRLRLPAAEYTRHTSIIVLDIAHAGGTMLMGAVVDNVSEVVSVQEADMEDAPDFGDGRPPHYVLGIAKSKGQIRILLDIDCVLTSQGEATTV